MSSVETATLFPVTQDEYGAREYRRKIEPEPPSWACYGPDIAPGGVRWLGERPGGSSQFADSHYVPCPFTPGQVLAIQEEWHKDRLQSDMIIYASEPFWGMVQGDKEPMACIAFDGRSLSNEEAQRLLDTNPNWSLQPASTMPLWAVRRWERVTEIVGVEGGCWHFRTEDVER